MLMAITVIAIVLLLTVAVILYKRKKEAERRRLQEEELEAFLNSGHGGECGWFNIGRQETSSSFDSVPVLHRQTSSASYVPDQENHLPVKTLGQRIHRFR